MRGTFASNPRLRAVEWRDLLVISPVERFWELIISLPWLFGSLACYQMGWYWLGALCSFYFFLTGLRQSHGAQHYTLGLPPRVQDAVLFVLSTLMLASMHAVQVSHLHHHRHCLDSDDAEGSTARLPWWKALLVGPFFPIRLHRAAWRLASTAKRRWIVVEVVAIVVVVLAVIVLPSPAALRWHVMAMVVGESLTGFFAVWTVHHGCDPAGLLARTQRGRLFAWFSYSMFFHAEHHLFPLVPTCRLARLAERLDAIAPDLQWQRVLGASNSSNLRMSKSTLLSSNLLRFAPAGWPPAPPIAHASTVKRMRAHSPEINLTEFLAKSLVGAGVFLAIPAALSAAVAAFMLWRTWPYRAGSYLGWLAFCGIGFFLLGSSIRIVRSPERVRRPRLVWLGVSAYLAVILSVGGAWLFSSFQLAQQGNLRDWGGDTLGPDILVVPALLLLVPLWAFILSTALCMRRKCA